MVASWPRRKVQLGMGAALLAAAGLFAMTNLHLLPGGGDALSLQGGRFAAGLAGNFALGALMTLGIGLYARYVDYPDAFRAGYDDLLSTVGMADAAAANRQQQIAGRAIARRGDRRSIACRRRDADNIGSGSARAFQYGSSRRFRPNPIVSFRPRLLLGSSALKPT